jgi:hypothetical protein
MRIQPLPPTQISDFEEHFSTKTLARGQELIEKNAVRILECSSDHIRAQIQEEQHNAHDVHINSSGEFDCTCDSGVRPCHHIAASLIAAVHQHKNFEQQIHNLDAAQAKALLLELANTPQVRSTIAERMTSTPRVNDDPAAEIPALRNPDENTTEEWLEPDPTQLTENHALTNFATPEEHEQHLRSNLQTPQDHLALTQHLRAQQREPEALEVASIGVRDEINRLDRGHGGITVFQRGTTSTQTAFADEMLELIQWLRTTQPSFEWERAAFRIKPNLQQYKTLKTYPEFNKADLLKHLEPSLQFEVALEDNDHTTLGAMLRDHPIPGYARKVKHVFPEQARAIFKTGVEERIRKGAREYYREAAQLAKEYQGIEDPAVFKAWLEPILRLNARRLTLLDEFAQQGFK